MTVKKKKEFYPLLQSDDPENMGEFFSIIQSEEDEMYMDEKLPDVLPLLPLRNTVLFPGTVIPITIGRPKSIQLINDVLNSNKKLGVVAQKAPEVEDPEEKDLFFTGTVAHIIKKIELPDGNTMVIIQGIQKFRIRKITNKEPYFIAEIDYFRHIQPSVDKELRALMDAMKEVAIEIINLTPHIPKEAGIAIKNLDSPLFLVNFIASNTNADIKEKQKILEINNFKKQAQSVLGMINKELEHLRIKNEIQSKVKTDINKQQRDFFLQQQLKAIHDELGLNTPEKELEEFRKRALKKKWSKEVQEVFDKELHKLNRMNPAAAEYSVVANYIELLLDLPWNHHTKDNLNLDKARKILNQDHYGLEKIKERILEYLSVIKLKGNMKSPIICLYGPPGVGKTSLGKSVARAMGRQYIRMSLGGLRDEAEIRGHRKTYIGAMPGRIIQSIKKAKSSNPLIVLDEIDKVGSDFRGDPASALLEVLDPEQNTTFYDNYLEMEYDLSHVMFIATANTLNTIHPALRDRLEIIELSGYLMDEKIHIAQKYLLTKQRELHGLTPQQLRLTKNILVNIIEHYTRESGVRLLEKKIAKLCRWQAKSIVSNKDINNNFNKEKLHEVFGPGHYEKDTYTLQNTPGISTGLAWTSVGGDRLFIEVNLSPGKGKLQLTGKLGEVMKESAILAISYLKSKYKTYNINPNAFEFWDIHIHVPEGAVPKDGPSAGITLLSALASMFTQRVVKKHIAMTGELTLRGAVLPVGGIKEKILAAKRAGMKEVILCEYNRKDVEDINEKYRTGLKFHYVKNASEVIDIALEKEKISHAIEINTPDFMPDAQEENKRGSGTKK
jgi:ATP-dependent Lon protease